ncbi:unnamed protein product [Paramecium pentaurelia]|uniref:Uncharacterized protein n=1 Tax=Paramecium pentaurelia TaxID=43138 RepID=A0A8S1VFQ7_9CILI|nr:unnamed protein product [Paramecium pentaurelia]
MLGKKQSQCVGFNPFSKYAKEKPSISTKIINKLKSLFQVNLNPSSCIQRELISQQTIYVPVNSEIVGAQTIEQDSIKICHSQSSQRQRRNKYTSFDDHLKEQQSDIVQQNDQSSKVQQKEEKELRKLNSLKKSFDPVLPKDIDNAEIKENKITHPRRKLSSQQYKKRKLDEKKKLVGIKFVHKKQVQDQIQDSINESRIQEVQEQTSDDSLKNNSLLAVGLKGEPQNKEITIVQLNDEKSKQPDPPMLTVNEIIEHQSKGLKKSQSRINLNEQEAKSFSCSPKKLENSSSRKQSDVINKNNEPKESEPQKNNEIIQQQEENKQENNQDEKQLEPQVEPQQTVINFLIQGPVKQDKTQTPSILSNLLNKVIPEEKKTVEQQEKNINNFSDTPLFGFGKSNEGLQGQMLASKINVQSSLFASYDSKELNQQQSSDQSSMQNLQQNQFTFLQNKPNVSEAQQQPSNTESSSSNVNNKKDSLDQQPKIEENKQIYSLFNNISGSQNDQFNTNDQFRPKKQLFQNFLNVAQSTQGEQKDENKQDQTKESIQIQIKPEEQKSVSLFSGIVLQVPDTKNQPEKNNNTITQKEQEQSISPIQSFFKMQTNDNNNKEKPSTGLFGDLLIKQNEKEKINLDVKVEEQPPLLNNVNSVQINKIQDNKDTTNNIVPTSIFGTNSLFNFGNKNNLETPTNQDSKQQQNNSSKPEIQTPLPNSIGLNCQWKSSSDDQKQNNQFNINSEPKQQKPQSPFAFLQQQQPKSEHTKSDNLSSDQIIKSIATPVKPIDNPFLQQSPKIDQEQIDSYFSNHSQQNRVIQDGQIKVQTSLFQSDLFKQQNNGPSMFNFPQYPQQQTQPQPQQLPIQTQVFSFQQIPQQNQFPQQNTLFQTGLNNYMNMSNNGMHNEMEYIEMPQPNQQLQYGQQQQQQLNPFQSILQPSLSAPSTFPTQLQQQISGGFNAVQLFQQNSQPQHDLTSQLFSHNQNNSLFPQDQSKSVNQSQSLNSSFQSRDKKKKQRI